MSIHYNQITIGVACIILIISSSRLLAQPRAIPKSAADADQKYQQANRAAKIAYDKALLRAATQYVADLEAALKTEMTLGPDHLDNAKRIDDARKAAIEARQNIANRIAMGAGPWRVIFHSSDPSIWDTTKNDKDDVSIALSNNQTVIRYVRLCRLDSGDFVILRLPRATHISDLTKKIECDKFIWNGTCQREKWSNATDWQWNYRLGIAQKDRLLHYHDGGVVVLETSDREGYAGWGFGKRPLAFSDQQYGWVGENIDGGNEVKTKIGFEISVSSNELDNDDIAYLLNPDSEH